MATPSPITLHIPEDLRVDYDPHVRVVRRKQAKDDEEILGPPQPSDPVILRLASPSELRSVRAKEHARRLSSQRSSIFEIRIDRANEISYEHIDEVRRLAGEANVAEVVVYVRQRE